MRWCDSCLPLTGLLWEDINPNDKDELKLKSISSWPGSFLGAYNPHCSLSSDTHPGSLLQTRVYELMSLLCNNFWNSQKKIFNIFKAIEFCSQNHSKRVDILRRQSYARNKENLSNNAIVAVIIDVPFFSHVECTIL